MHGLIRSDCGRKAALERKIRFSNSEERGLDKHISVAAIITGRPPTDESAPVGFVLNSPAVSPPLSKQNVCNRFERVEVIILN